MRSKRLVLLAVSVALCSICLAKPHTVKREASGLAPVVDSRGTASSPISVSIQESASDAEDKVNSERHRSEDTANNRLIMIFTGGTMLVGVLQLALFFWQLRLMRSTVADGTVAARAAELNAHSAVGIELPIIRFPPVDLLTTAEPILDEGPYGGAITDGPPTRFSAIGGIRATNHGRTPAFPSEIAIGWAFGTGLPVEPAYAQRSLVNHAKVISANANEECDLEARHFTIELSEQQIADAAAETGFLWLYGCLFYRDFLDEPREARFCWRYANRNPAGMRPFFAFASDGSPPPKYVARR